MADDHDDRTPKVTPHVLLRGDAMCPRRLAHELDGRAGDASAFTRWRLRSPFVEAATLAHRAGSTAPTTADFPVPVARPPLEPEELALWRRAVGTYLARFADVPATTIDHGCESATVSAHFGVRVGGAVDVLVRLEGGDVELRQFELWRRPVCADPMRPGNWEIALAVLRLARLVPGRLRIVHLDLVSAEVDTAEVDYERDLAPLREAFGRRLGELRSRAATGEAVAGTGCGQCHHLAGCPAHREVA